MERKIQAIEFDTAVETRGEREIERTRKEKGKIGKTRRNGGPLVQLKVQLNRFRSISDAVNSDQ